MAGHEQELRAALEAVRGAARVCRAVQERLITRDTLEKREQEPRHRGRLRSPGPSAAHLTRPSRRDAVIAEEHCADLLLPENARSSIRSSAPSRARSAPSMRSAAAGSIAAARTRLRRALLDARPDRRHQGLPARRAVRGRAGADRRHGSRSPRGVPELPVERGDGRAAAAAIVAAVRGRGARVRSDGRWRLRPSPSVPWRPGRRPRFCESVESGHTRPRRWATVAAARHHRGAGPDGQPGQVRRRRPRRAEIYLRLPTRADYREKIWDQAAGSIVVEEAGGTVTDSTASRSTSPAAAPSPPTAASSRPRADSRARDRRRS